MTAPLTDSFGIRYSRCAVPTCDNAPEKIYALPMTGDGMVRESDPRIASCHSHSAILSQTCRILFNLRREDAG